MIRKRIHFEIVSRYDREQEPATAAVPFKRGELRKEEAGKSAARRRESLRRTGTTGR